MGGGGWDCDLKNKTPAKKKHVNVKKFLKTG